MSSLLTVSYGTAPGWEGAYLTYNGYNLNGGNANPGVTFANGSLITSQSLLVKDQIGRTLGGWSPDHFQPRSILEKCRKEKCRKTPQPSGRAQVGSI